MKIFKCCIILHNMGVEKREELEVESYLTEASDDDIVIGGNATLIWGNLESLDFSTVVPPGLLAAPAK